MVEDGHGHRADASGWAWAPQAVTLVTSALVGHHVPDMHRDVCTFGGFWFFYAGERPA
jgi:hypothetical protein